LLHNKILQAMSEREKSYVLRGKVQLVDAYLGEKTMVECLVADQTARYRSSHLMMLVTHPREGG